MVEENLKQKTVKGVLWNGIHSFAMKTIQFLLMLFMARLLSPSDYGTIGIISVFLTISSTFIECGFTSALIRKKDRTQTDLSTVFFYNIAVSSACYAILFFAAPYIAEFYKMPVVTNILRVLGLSLVFNSFNIVHATILNYTMNFKRHAVIAAVRESICGILGIALAFCGFGVWALVIQSVSAPIVAFSLFWGWCKWRPSFTFSTSSFKEMFGYSSKILLTRIIDTIYGSIHTLVIGKFFSPSALGHYSRANHWASFPSSISTSVLQNVSFASLATIQDDNERLNRVYRKMIRTSAFVIFPCMMGLSAIAHPLIVFTIGEKWEFCSKILQIICFSFMLQPIHSLNINLLQVKGRSDLSLYLSIIQKTIAFVFLILSIKYGILAMCSLGVLTSILMLVANTYYTGKEIKLGFFKQMRDVFPIFVLSSFMFLCVYLSIQISDISILQVLIGTLVGIFVYVSGAYIFKMEEIGEVMSMFKNMVHRK